MPKLAVNQPPPPHYYADNLRQLLSHVQHHYADVLSDAEHQFIGQVSTLSSDAQRLFARLLGRKGPWIRIDRLRYPEVGDLTAALGELEAGKLVAVNGPAPADALLGLLVQTERQRLFPGIGCPHKGRSKHQHVTECLGRYPDALIARRVAAEIPWVCVARYPMFHRCQLLFFGDPYQDLTTFVLQDLGLLNYERYTLCRQTRQFADRRALQRYLRLLELASLTRRVDELDGLAETVLAELLEKPSTLRPTCVEQPRLEKHRRDKILNHLGRWFERRGDIDQALACYAASTRHPARERQVRLLKARADMAGVERLLNDIRDQPWSAQEQDFAERFGHRRRCCIPTTQVPLTAPPAERIEHHAMERLACSGQRVWHLENSFPLGLAGLAYWPVVFAEVPGAFVNPFQAGPVDLFWEDFLAPRQELFAAQEARLAADMGTVLRTTFAAKVGVNNRLVSWGAFTPEVLQAVLATIPPADLHRLARYVLQNLARARVGFPDLLVLGEPGHYEFVEVKGPTDQLQPAQRVWFKTLAGFAMPARVLKFTA